MRRWGFFAASCEHGSVCQIFSPGRAVVSLLPLLPLPFEADFDDNVENLGSPSQRGGRHVRSCESTRVWSRARGGFLGQVGVEVSLGSVGNLFQSSLQLTRRPNEPGQGLLLWASPAKPSKAVRAITQTLQPT